MQSQPLRRGGPAQGAEGFNFEHKLENEEATLDAMLAALTRGALPPGSWDRLHAAAHRDERSSELAFAFESASQSKRLKALSPAIAAEFVFQAGRFFGDVFGDPVGAVAYLERALALVPGHALAFAKMEQILRANEQHKKLAELYGSAAHHRPRGEQATLLRRAADLFSQVGGADDKVIDLLQQVLRGDPSDERTREELESLCIKANRLRDVVRLNEQALAAEPPPDEATRRKLLARIVEVYAEKLHEPERAMPHVEQLLGIDPASELGRRVAEKLVVVKGLAGRAAAALANAHEAVGAATDVARYVTIELENTRGPRRATLLARLARLRQERLHDDPGAFEAFEQALAIDAADDDLRTMYVTLARKLGRVSDAAKTMGRVLSTMKSPEGRARASAQLGQTLFLGGDLKRAQETLAGVLASADAPSDAQLTAAYVLCDVFAATSNRVGVCEALERIALLESDPLKRLVADERLAQLATDLGDTARAIAAYERLVSTSARPRALAALAQIYEHSSDPEKHARLLEQQAKDEADPAAARSFMVRSAEVRASLPGDRGAAIACCGAIVERFGPARDVLAIAMPLLEAQRRWAELARALGQEAALTTGLEHAHVMTRLGALRMQRLGEIAGAIDALGAALAVDPNDKNARMMLEKLTVIGDHRLGAARVLEPVYRSQGSIGSLVKMLELRGSLAPDVDQRLGALREAATLADSAEAGRSAEVVGRALADAVAHGRALGEWLEKMTAAGIAGSDAKRRAAILSAAIGDHDVTSQELSVLAKLGAEAHASCGDGKTAIALYRRALSFEPHSTQLLSRIDDLLRDQGSPHERVALYRAAIERGGETSRIDLLRRIAAVEWHDLDDPTAAIATYRAVLHEDLGDVEAQAALEELYGRTDRWMDLCALLENRLGRVDGDSARATRASLATAAAAHGDRERAREHCARLLEDPELSPEQLEAAARAAAALGDADLERAVLQLRAETAESKEQIVWLNRLGELEQERRGDLVAAASAWKRAAALADASGQEDAARTMLWRAHAVAPKDRELTIRLVALSERGQIWHDLPKLYTSLSEQSSDEEERVDLWLRTARVVFDYLGDAAGAAQWAGRAFAARPGRADVLSTFEHLTAAAGATEAFEQAIGAALSRLDSAGGLDGGLRGQLTFSLARALAADPRRLDDASRAYRNLLAEGSLGRAQAAGAMSDLEALVAVGPVSPQRRTDRRWLFEWRTEHAAEGERVARLLDWARDEESTHADPAHALALYRKVLDHDPDSDEALAAVTRLALVMGDSEAALTAMRARRDRADGPARVAIDLDIARVLLSRATGWPEALGPLRAVLAEVPNDPTARALAGQLLSHGAARRDAMEMLEQACDATEDVEARAQILTRLLDAPASSDDADARRGWFERLCELRRAQGQLAASMATAIRAAREMPHVSELWDRADALARETSRPHEMASLYEEVLARALTREQATCIGERAVQFYEEWFDDSARVAGILERVLEVDPTADWAFDRLKLLLDSAERWDDVFALYDRALSSAEGQKRIALLEDAAHTAKDFADRPDRAIQYLEQLNEISGGDATLTAALERLYERQGKHRELVALLTLRVPKLSADEARRTRARVAALWLDELGDPDAALDAVEPALQRADELTSSPGPDVWSLLERILAATPCLAVGTSRPPRRSSSAAGQDSGGPADPIRERARQGAWATARQRTARYLREHYASEGRDADLLRMLLVELEAVKSPAERARRHLEIADGHEKLGDLLSAFEQVGRAVATDPDDEVRRERLVRLAERTGRLERLADLLVIAADATSDEALRISLSMRAAGVRADRIGDAAGAIALLTSVLATPGLADESVLAAGRKIELLLDGAGRGEERLEILERIAGVEPDAAARTDALGHAAKLAARLGQDDRAVLSWEKRVARDEGDVEALDGLVELLGRAHRPERLAHILRLRARVATSGDRRRADHVRMARLLGDVLGEHDAAVAAWREIERDFGETDETAFALATLLTGACEWNALAALLARGAERTVDMATRAELLRQLGDVHREHLGARAAALETYARAMVADPHNRGVRRGLLALTEDHELSSEAVANLLEGLRACDDWSAILELAPRRLLAARSDRDRLDVLVETCGLAERRAGDVAAAFDAMRSALLVAPSDEGIEGEACRLAEALGAWESLVAAYEVAINGAAAPHRALVSRLRMKAAAALETRLDDPEGALALYKAVVSENSGVDAGCAAVRLAGKLSHWDVAAGVVVDIARGAESGVGSLLEAYDLAAVSRDGWDDAARALESAVRSEGLQGPIACRIESRIAGWHRDRRGDPDAARSALERALTHDDSDPTLLVMLVDLQRPVGGRPLVHSLLHLSRARGGDPSLLREAAEIARDSVGDLGLTRSIVTDLLSTTRERWTDPAQPDAAECALSARWSIECLAALYQKAGDARAMVDLLAQAGTLPLDREVRRAMRRHAARAALESLGDVPRAIALYCSLLDEDPRDRDAADRLASIYAAPGRLRDLLALRERLIESAESPGERSALRLEAARLLVRLDEPSRASEMLRVSLVETPRDQPTVEALAEALESQGRLPEVRDFWVEQGLLAEGGGDTARAADLLWRGAVLTEGRLEDAETAERLFARVAALEPRPAALDALGRLAMARADHAAAVCWLGRLLDVVPSDQRVEVTLRLADAHAGSGDWAGAARCLTRSLGESPDAEPLRHRLAALYRGQGQWVELAALVSDGASHAPGKAARMDRLLQAATLLIERCARPDMAIPLLEQASDLAPDDQTVRLALAAALAQGARFDDARSMLRSLVDGFGGRRPKARALVHYQIARLELAVGNRAPALLELDKAARVDPQNPDILRSLAELAKNDGQLERAEKSYRALLVVLRRRGDEDRAPGIARSEVLLELHAIALEQSESSRATEILESALEAATKSDFEEERLEAALHARGDYETLARALSAKLARMGETSCCPLPSSVSKTLSDLAGVLADHLGRTEEAFAVRMRAVAIDPGSAEAHEAALALARGSGEVGQYVDRAVAIIDRALHARNGETSKELACSLLVRLGKVAEDDMRDQGRSAAFYERAVDLGLRTPEVLRALDHVLGRLGETEKQARVLAMRVEAEATAGGGPRAASDAIYRLAALHLNRRETFDEGLEMMRTVLDLDPQLDRAEEALRRAVSLDPTHGGALALFERVGRHPGRERALVEALAARFDLPGGEIDTVREAVDVAGRIGDDALAASLLERVIEKWRARRDAGARLAWALEALAAVKRRAGDTAVAVDLQVAAARHADPANARRLTLDAARIAADELPESDIGARIYEELFRADPSDRSAWEPLAAVYRRQGDAHKLAELIAVVVDNEDDPEARAKLRLERVRALLALGLDEAEARPLLREIVEEGAAHVEAALMLAAILERAGATGELRDLLARQIDSAKDRGQQAEVASLSLWLGALLGPDERSLARDIYYTALEWEPADRPVLDALANLLCGETEAAERADVVERRLSIERGQAAEPIALGLAAARGALGDEAGAERAIEIGLRGYPQSSVLRQRLEAALRARADWRGLADLLGRERETAKDDARLLAAHVQALLQAEDEAAAIIEWTTALERLAEDDPRRAEWLAARADVRARCGDGLGALEDLEAAFAVENLLYAPALVARLEVTRDEAKAADNTDAVRCIRLRLAHVLPFAGNPEMARGIVIDLLRNDPKDREALRSLAAMETVLGRWDAAGAALKRLVGLEDGDRAVDTALRLAEACERAGRTGEARGALERARLLAPHDPLVRKGLARVYEQTSAWHELAELTLEDARASGDVTDRFTLLLRAGSLMLERASDAEAAIDALEEARALRPLDPTCVAHLADAYSLSGRDPEAVHLLETVILPHKGRRARELAPLYFRLAKVSRSIGNGAAEIRALCQALECDSQNGQVCADVAMRAIEIEQFDLANRALRSITLLKAPATMTKAVAYRHMGQIAHAQGDPKRALALLQRALSEDPLVEGARALVQAIERGLLA